MNSSMLINLKQIGDPEIGYLSFFESSKDIPFDVKRVYYTYDVPVNIKRGMHAHKNLQQLLWCPYGEIEIILDNGKCKETYTLNSPYMGLLVTNGVWRDIYCRKKGSVLCVAASDYYTEEDYIRDYNEFLDYVKKGYWEN
jgi:dTDP-4-dehydrorhamnose 3,5-epimerase-like enzyme